MSRQNKTVNYILKAFIIALSIITVIEFVKVCYELKKENIELSLEQWSLILDKFAHFGVLFLATLTVWGFYYSFVGIQISKEGTRAAEKANDNAIKENSFKDWKDTLEQGFKYSDRNDPEMKTEFIVRQRDLFEDLYKLKFQITDKDVLADLFNKHFKDSNFPDVCERKNDKFYKNNCVYRDRKSSYSFDSFCYVFRRSLKREYPNFEMDLKTLYVDCLPQDRVVITTN